MYTKKFALLVLATLSTAILASSCAGPESYQQKMARYEPKTINKNQVPDIKTTDFKFTTTTNKSSRAPASAPETPNLNQENKEINPTNKKLYFLSLLSEYESLKNFSPEFSGPNISICPNFHTSLLRHNDRIVENNKNTQANYKFSYDSKKYNDETYIASRPELLLPLAKDEVTPKVIDIIKNSHETMTEFAVNELVHKALDIHLAKTYGEINELCEYGVSDNYYIYENLITHIKNNTFEADSKNMNILLKTTVFSNIALVTSLEKNKVKPTGRSIASFSDEQKNTYSSEIIARLNVSWANQYFNFIKESK